MTFGKLNRVQTYKPSPVASEAEPAWPRGGRYAIGFAAVLIVLTSFGVVISPKHATFSWWFGTRPETPYMVGVAAVIFLVLAYSNLRDDRRRLQRQRQRSSARANEGMEPFTPVWPEWCTEYGRADGSVRGGDGDFGGGDCGGGDGGGGD